MTTAETASPFADAEIIYAYTTEDAVRDGVLFDAREFDGEAGKIIRQRYHGSAVYFTAGLRALVQKAVDHPRWCNDLAGVVWDIVMMSSAAVNRAAQQAMREGSGRSAFVVIITGTGRVRNHRVIAAIDGNGLTFMLPGDD